MTTYVMRNGRLVLKDDLRKVAQLVPSMRAEFPSPRISRMEPYESPIDGHEVTSWAERDREMKANDAYDPRDLPQGHVYSRGREVQENERSRQPEQPDLFEWRDPV